MNFQRYHKKEKRAKQKTKWKNALSSDFSLGEILSFKNIYYPI